LLQDRRLGSYVLRRINDSLYYLNQWRLPYPVYQFQTGDVDCDGQPDALVGVVKSTRFYCEKGRRLFIFKLMNGKVRPLWMGSKLGGQLVDFKFVNGRVRSLEISGRQSTDRNTHHRSQLLYTVSEWQWNDFGLQFHHYLIHQTDSITAKRYYCQ
jgi:hypothetical protein